MNLKDFFEDNRIGKLVKSVGTGVLKGTPLLGNIVTEMRDNEDDIDTGLGKTDIARATSYSLVCVLFIGRIIWPEHINAELFSLMVEIITEL